MLTVIAWWCMWTNMIITAMADFVSWPPGSPMQDPKQEKSTHSRVASLAGEVRFTSRDVGSSLHP